MLETARLSAVFRIWAVCLVVCCGLAGASMHKAAAQELSAPEYELKAAFVYNFAKLAEWPTNTFITTNSPIVIGILGKDPFGGSLEKVTDGRTIDGRPIKIERFSRVEDIRVCHLLFVAPSETGRLDTLFKELGQRPVLTVGNDNFARKGGMIGLIKQRDEIRFEVNLKAVNAAELKLSSRMLGLAIIVSDETEGGGR